MDNIKGKKLLILGGSSASLDLVKTAKAMGLYTIITDNSEGGAAKEFADEIATVSTIDMEGLQELIRDRKIDGVFCGPSEFNLRNVIRLCEITGLPCYTNMETWDRCAKKDAFKAYCRQCGVDCTPEYQIDRNTSEEELKKLDYPVIIKPVDGSSSAGITVCQNAAEIPAALEKAYGASPSDKIICEKFIENSGEIFSVRYLLRNGEAYPYFMMDTYVADPIHRKSLISHCTLAPSKYSQYYMEHMDQNVRRMLKKMGLKNGTAFIQSLPYKGKIYFHEMGYRLSGGMVFKLTEPMVGIHDMRIMLRGAVGGEALTDTEIQRIDLSCGDTIGGQLMFPLNVGTIGKIEGLEEIKQLSEVKDVIQYYRVGDTIAPKNIGTLAQHFCRVTFICQSQEKLEELLAFMKKTLIVYDDKGNRMNTLLFDTERIHQKQ